MRCAPMMFISCKPSTGIWYFSIDWRYKIPAKFLSTSAQPHWGVFPPLIWGLHKYFVVFASSCRLSNICWPLPKIGHQTHAMDDESHALRGTPDVIQYHDPFGPSRGLGGVVFSCIPETPECVWVWELRAVGGPHVTETETAELKGFSWVLSISNGSGLTLGNTHKSDKGMNGNWT